MTLGDDLVELARERCAPRDWPALAASAPADVRWVWSDTSRWYPQVLAAGTTLRRCHDLRLCHAVLRLSALVDAPDALRAATEWDAAPAEAERAPTLFDLADGAGAEVPDDLASVLAEFHRQQQALADAPAAARLRLLLGIESAGALLAAEMHAAGVPWSRAIHERLLEESLGPRPTPGVHPQRVQELAGIVRTALGDPAASLDSQPKLLRSLHRVGVLARSTSRWELAEYDHPAIAPLLAYKKLTRLLSANGWAWLDEWAPDGRFRPVYVPGGVVTMGGWPDVWRVNLWLRGAGRVLAGFGSCSFEEPAAELAALPNVRILARTTVFGWYDSSVFGAVERVQKHVAVPDPHRPVERLWRIVAKAAVLATGAEERPLVFGGNDRPGARPRCEIGGLEGLLTGDRPGVGRHDDRVVGVRRGLSRGSWSSPLPARSPAPAHPRARTPPSARRMHSEGVARSQPRSSRPDQPYTSGND